MEKRFYMHGLYHKGEFNCSTCGNPIKYPYIAEDGYYYEGDHIQNHFEKCLKALPREAYAVYEMLQRIDRYDCGYSSEDRKWYANQWEEILIKYKPYTSPVTGKPIGTHLRYDEEERKKIELGMPKLHRQNEVLERTNHQLRAELKKTQETLAQKITELGQTTKGFQEKASTSSRFFAPATQQHSNSAIDTKDPKGYFSALWMSPDVPEDVFMELLGKNYRVAAKRYHTDRGGDVNHFHKVQEAYEYLSNADNRKAYRQSTTPSSGRPSFS